MVLYFKFFYENSKDRKRNISRLCLSTSNDLSVCQANYANLARELSRDSEGGCQFYTKTASLSSKNVSASESSLSKQSLTMLLPPWRMGYSRGQLKNFERSHESGGKTVEKITEKLNVNGLINGSLKVSKYNHPGNWQERTHEWLNAHFQNPARHHEKSKNKGKTTQVALRHRDLKSCKCWNTFRWYFCPSESN